MTSKIAKLAFIGIFIIHILHSLSQNHGFDKDYRSSSPALKTFSN